MEKKKGPECGSRLVEIEEDVYGCTSMLCDYTSDPGYDPTLDMYDPDVYDKGERQAKVYTD